MTNLLGAGLLQDRQRLNANIAASHVFGGSVDCGDGSLDTAARLVCIQVWEDR